MFNEISIDIVYKILEYDSSIKYINRETINIPWTYCVYKIGDVDKMGNNIFHNARKLTLDCYKKKYTINKIKEFLKQIPNVENIELYYYNFDYFPLTDLKQLTLYNCDIVNFQNYKIDVIDLDYNRLTEIKLKENDEHIQRIYCVNVISDYINLSNLKILHLCNCVVLNISGLPNLKKLSISDSSIGNITLENSSKLEEVSIAASNMSIIELPISIKHLNINRISMSVENQISFYSFEKYVNLESLCIYNDFVIKRVPYIETLRILDLNFCTNLEKINKKIQLDEFMCLNCDKLYSLPNLCNLKEYTITKTNVS